MIENGYPNHEDEETFEDIPGEAQEALLKWLNLTEPDEGDKARLLTLWNAGAFRAWRCPMCGDECFDGQPEDADLSWGDFQGVLNPDGSFFSDRDIFTEEFIGLCCDTCRCHPQRFFPGSGIGDYP